MALAIIWDPVTLSESLLPERILIQELQQKRHICMNYLARARKTFAECGPNIPYNLPIVSCSITCSLARRNQFPRYL